MPLPGNLTTITLTGKFLDSTGAPLSGTLSFTPVPELVDPANAILYSAPVNATLDGTGAFSVTLICTDNANLLPVGWFYSVIENVRGTRTYPIYVPHSYGTTVDLSSVVPVPDLTGAVAVIPSGVVAPGYGGLAYNQTWTGANTFSGAVTLTGAVSFSGAVTGVNTIDGVTVSGTAASGKSISATSPTAAAWNYPGAGDWVNAKSYGATGNGTTDDTAAIQAAIAALPATGGVVYLPTGSYLLDGAALSLSTAGTVLRGAGAENTKLLIGATFTGAAAVAITAYNCQVRDLSVNGSSSTTTTNPAANAIEITAVRRAKITRCTFTNVNGWCIEAVATNASGTSNPLSTQINGIIATSCAGGVHFLGNTTQGYAVNSSISDMQFYLGGVTTGASANLDAIRIEDAWDVLSENVIAWMSNGTGSAYHIKGNCAASFALNLDALGPSTAPCVLIEDGANGSVQNAQITGGVIQQGSIGLQISGASNQVHISSLRIINNQTHGVQVDGTSQPIHLLNCFFSLNGAGAVGTNYDINWSGTAKGNITNCWFGTPVVATGTAGVQNTLNIAAAGQNVLVLAAKFAGTGASSSNWYTNLPAGLLETTSGTFNFASTTTFSGSTPIISKGLIAAQPTASGNTALSTNVSGSDAFDRFRLLGSGSISWGTGSAARDTTLARASSGGLTLTQPSTLVETIGGLLQAQTSTVTVANTIAATALTSFTVPANDAATGGVYAIEGYGIYSTTGTPTLQFILYWGGTAGTALATIPAITTPSGAANIPFRYSALVTVRSTTSVVGMLTLHFGTSTTTDQVTSYLNAPTAATTVTTTGANALAVGVTWGTASASNTISLLGGAVSRLA